MIFYVLARCLTVATEMLKELKLRRLPVNLKTMIDVLVSVHHDHCYRTC